MSKHGLEKFVLGAGLGAGLALLFAPQEGSKTRKELKIKFDELVEKAKKIDVNEVRDEILDKAYDLKEEIKALDKEKVLEIAKKSATAVEKKANELYASAKEAAEPYVEKAVKEVKDAALKTAKEVVTRLEEEEKTEKKSAKKVAKKKTAKKKA